MSNLVNRSRRAQQGNRKSRKINRNRSKRQIRKQRGGNNIEVSIYCNLKESNSREILTRPLIDNELWDVDTYVKEEVIENSKDPRNSSEELSSFFKLLTKDSIEQLSSPYKQYHFLLKLTLPKAEAEKLADKTFSKQLMDNLAGEYVRFDYPYDYTGPKDRNKYFFSWDDYEVVGAGNTSAPPEAIVNKKGDTLSMTDLSTEIRACVQKNYNIKTKTGSEYSMNRCIISDDPNVNDTDKCMWNRPTWRCRKVSKP